MLAFRWDIRIRLIVRFIESHTPVPSWTAFKAFGGIGFIAWGFSMLTGHFWTGVTLVYAGLFFLFVEFAGEPRLHSRPYWRLIALATTIGVTVAFSARVVLVKAPIDVDAYTMRKGEYASGTAIAGIQWNPHFTDLRVWIKNETDNDYGDVDLAVQPDRWNYKAAIVGDDYGCRLDQIGGGELSIAWAKGGGKNFTSHREGNQTVFSDDVGDVFQPFLNQGGDRLICTGKIPAHSSIQILFALASVAPGLGKDIGPSRPLKSNEMSLGVAELKPTDPFNTLAPRPAAHAVTIDGRYNCGAKRFFIEKRKIIVEDEN